MRARVRAAHALAALLLLASAVVASGESVVDGFETGALGPLWTARAASGRVTVQGDVVRSGAFALRLEVREGDMAGVGGDGEATERTEVQLAHEAAHFGETHEYAFSMYVPHDFPIVDTRLVTSQWKQTCDDCSRNRSPIVAQRYRRGILMVTFETPKGRQRIYEHPEPIQGRWLDLRYQIRFHLTDGAVTVWMNGTQVVDYQGPLGFPDDPPDVYFRLGLYRTGWRSPWSSTSTTTGRIGWPSSVGGHPRLYAVAPADQPSPMPPTSGALLARVTRGALALPVAWYNLGRIHRHGGSSLRRRRESPTPCWSSEERPSPA